MASLNAKGYGAAPALGIPPGFVKDPNSSWYVNSTTGMYYDVNSKSYLHSATGKYYYLDVATNSLKEWAAAAVPAVPSAAVAAADKFLQVSISSTQNALGLIITTGNKRQARCIVRGSCGYRRFCCSTSHCCCTCSSGRCCCSRARCK